MKLSIDYNEKTGRVKPMNAVNNGPVYTKNKDQNAGNLETYTEAGIPFARTHDASFFARYGGEHTVDVHAIFPNFDADPELPESYDFQLTDEYMETIGMAGTQVFYRLGSKIEHNSKKYGIIPPKDNQKWAVICEHIIAHMNEGWADGHHYGITYWEIWNEPDLYGKCWMGTKEQFYDLFTVTFKRLKARFPGLKIGGPAVCSFNLDWLRPFFSRLRTEGIVPDFFSWHSYRNMVSNVIDDVRRYRALLDEYGFTDTESILDEWNYVSGWTGERWTYTLNAEIGIKGGAFIAAVMAACQDTPVDMLMYYDARPCVMNGLFSQNNNYEPLKGYYAIRSFGEMYKMGTACRVTCDVPDIYAVAASDAEGHRMAMVTFYTDNDNAAPRTFTVEIAGADHEMFSLSLLDDTHNMTEVGTVCADGGKLTLTLAANTVAVIR